MKKSFGFLFAFLLLLFLLTGCETENVPVGTENADTAHTGTTETIPQAEDSSCAHQPVTDAAILPTCIEDGKSEGSHCGICGEVLVLQEVISSSGHQPITLEAIAPTCTEEGKGEGTLCGTCGTVLIPQEIIPAKGHRVVTDRSIAPSCFKDGLSQGSHCHTCKEVFVPQKPIPAYGQHQTTVTDPAVAPTCKTVGYTEGSHCSCCKEVLAPQKEIPALGHAPVSLPAAEPTCTKRGYNAHEVCERCNMVLTKKETTPALGHLKVSVKGVASTCMRSGLSDGEICSRCQETVKKQVMLPKTEHAFVNGVCRDCHQTELLVRISSDTGYNQLKADPNAVELCRLYDDIYAVAVRFYSDTTTDFDVVKDYTWFYFSDYNLLPSQTSWMVYDFFMEDHPLFHKTLFSTAAMWGSDNTFKAIGFGIQPKYREGKARAQCISMIEAGLKEYIAVAADATNNYETTLAYYNMILKNTRYAYAADGSPSGEDWAHSILGALDEHRAFVCEGYAKLLQVLLNYSGIENMYITGNTPGDHAWNLVRMDDGKWYWFDATWDDNKNDQWNYRYFCRADDFMNNRTVDDWITIPQPASKDFESDNILEINETFSCDQNTYKRVGYNEVKLIRINNADAVSDTVAYMGRTYTVIQ